MSPLISESKKKIYQRKLKDFWADFSRNRIGLLGLVMVISFIMVAVFAPYLSPYHPIEDKHIAEEMIPPKWIRIMPQFRDLPSTLEVPIDFDVVQGSDLVDVRYLNEDDELSKMLYNISISEWVIRLEGGTTEEIDIFLGWDFSYPYAPPESFSCLFRWRIMNLKNVGYNLELLMVRSGEETTEYSLWDSNTRLKHQERDVNLSYKLPAWHSAMKYGYPALVKLSSTTPTLYVDRLGFGIEESLANIVLSEKGEYGLVMHIRLKPESEDSSCEINIINPHFKIPGVVHGLLGTDKNGADVFSQLIYGSRISLAIGLLAALLTISIGTTVGVISGYIGGVIDEMLMRTVDLLLCMPVLPLLITLVFLFGRNVYFIIVLLGVFGWQGIARVVRSQVLSLRETAFIEAARAVGGSKSYIMMRHIVPNVFPVVFAAMILGIPGAILTEAALSFIGMGDPRYPTWGRMLNLAFNWGAFRQRAWWWLLPPGLCIMFLCLGFVLVGHSIDEIVNPRLRRRR